MLKKNKFAILLSCLVTLLPMLVGLLLWDRLPDLVPMHWNFAGEVDGWGSKGQLVFFLPLFLLAMHLICVFVPRLDPKFADSSEKSHLLVIWICPFITLMICTLVYAAALGVALSMEVLLPLILGGIFLVVGNFLPKCKQNYSVGIKLPWTLHDEANWNATHRFGGWVWVAGGALIMATSVLGSLALMLGLCLVMALAPTVYSYLYYRKHKKPE